MGKKVIITGATGMVGEGVMRQCLADPEIDKVLLAGRRSSGFSHPKIEELILPDMFNCQILTTVAADYDACLFCLGVSSVGMNEKDYTRLTYDLTIVFASVLQSANPSLIFCYVSGVATDSTEKGRSMWARVKGRTENKLISMFSSAYMFRPGYMQPDREAKNTLKYYKFVRGLYPLLRLLFPAYVCSLADLGRAMVYCVTQGYHKNVLEVADIRLIGEKQ